MLQEYQTYTEGNEPNPSRNRMNLTWIVDWRKNSSQVQFENCRDAQTRNEWQVWTDVFKEFRLVFCTM